jgi:hypothetical protein
MVPTQVLANIGIRNFSMKTFFKFRNEEEERKKNSTKLFSEEKKIEI